MEEEEEEDMEVDVKPGQLLALLSAPCNNYSPV